MLYLIRVVFLKQKNTHCFRRLEIRYCYMFFAFLVHLIGGAINCIFHSYILAESSSKILDCETSLQMN